MGSSAYIRSIPSLRQLSSAIAQFCADNDYCLSAIDQHIQQKISHMEEMGDTIRKRVQHAQAELSMAESALDSCQSQRTRDSNGNEVRPDCSKQIAELQRCRRVYQEAQDKYQRYECEIGKVRQNIATYQVAHSAFKGRLVSLRIGATSSMSQLINGAENYRAVQTQGVAPAFSASEKQVPLSGFGAVNGSYGSRPGGDVKIDQEWFECRGTNGVLIKLRNYLSAGVIRSMMKVNGGDFTCSELRIVRKGGKNMGQILKINIPDELKGEEVGKHFLSNMEDISRANQCDEINVWASLANLDFYRNLGYKERNERFMTGGEVFKNL
ncbi:hypothetical protein [Hufsiella ginkgonis]|uniref:Uncharacterized protein n=1 Tax=Hufsiella ginkgonis TaxID=2695274 RepID=A0A7K1XV05_9SPHI|nr:hypothetical protein [Hufsiella ginkgonis]MXV14814.1 hypothetical protein [Hufsiella ginkgonis]